MRLNVRIHRQLALILFLPLLASALTGVIYRLGRSWFGIPVTAGNFLMFIHQGEFLGQPLVPVYVLFVGLGLLGMIGTGLTILLRRRRRSHQQSKFSSRLLHRILAPIIFLPLIATSLTGIVYRLGKSWFGMSNQQAAIFLRIHQGTYLGPFWRHIYVLVVGIGLISMLITGINMTGIFRKRRVKEEVS